MYDLVIIGGGPAGVSAGIYASRKRLHSLLITKEWGGQSTVSPDIQNWVGTPSISGADLAASLHNHLLTYANDIVDIQENTYTNGIEKRDDGTFLVHRDTGEPVSTRTILVTSGSHRRRLNVPGANEFEHKGLTYCATCDGPLFAGQDVAVIGGGNAGFETAAQLLAYAKSVTLLHKGNQFKADPVTVEKVLSHEHMQGILNADTTAVIGNTFVSGLTYTQPDSQDITLDVTGIFVEIGMIPNTHFLEGVVELDEYQRVKIDPWTQQTSTPGIWAAGDCTNIKYHQNNISAGDAVRALEDIYVTLKAR